MKLIKHNDQCDQEKQAEGKQDEGNVKHATNEYQKENENPVN